MTKYCLLKKPTLQEPYRGLHRLAPDYRDSEPETSCYNTAWHRYVSAGEVLRDKHQALELLSIIDPADTHADLVLIEEVSSEQTLDNIFGYDVATQEWDSMLAWGLRFRSNIAETDLIYAPILGLLEDYFSPRLNKDWLFATFVDAQAFLDVTVALDKIVPGIWEAPGTYFPKVFMIAAVKY